MRERVSFSASHFEGYISSALSRYCQYSSRSKRKLQRKRQLSCIIKIFFLTLHKELKQNAMAKAIIETLDETDIKILRCLQQNARLTIKEIATEVLLSSTPVFERIKRMEREGYIKRYVTVLDAEKLHKGFVVFCSVKLATINKKVAEEFCATIREIPEVTECYNISGKYDYLLKVHAPDMKYYQEFILNVLGQIPMLGSLESTFVMEEVKNDFGVAI